MIKIKLFFYKLFGYTPNIGIDFSSGKDKTIKSYFVRNKKTGKLKLIGFDIYEPKN